MSNVQFITDAEGQKTGVVLSIKQYQKMLEDLEELEDIKAYDKAKRKAGKSQNFEEFLKELEPVHS